VRRALPIVLDEGQREHLVRWSRGGSTPFRLVIRSQIVLLASYGHSNRRIARLLRTNPITVARWRSRFALFGIEGLRREAPRNASPPRLPEAVVQRILQKTLSERPPNREHWSTRTMGRAVGVSHSAVRRVWKMYGIRPNRSRVALLAEDSPFRPKTIDLLGVYVNPPRRVVALSFSDGSNSAATGLAPLRQPPSDPPPGPSRPWMKDLVTTLGLLDRPGEARTTHRHVDQEFLAFLHSVQLQRAGNEKVALLSDAGDSDLSASVARWLSRHPQIMTQVRGDSESWEQMVLSWIRGLSAGGATESPPRNLPKLAAALARWKRTGGGIDRPFAWTPERAGESPR